MKRFFLKLCKQAFQAWCSYRGRQLYTCDDKACFRKPKYYVDYHHKIHWDLGGVLALHLGIRPMSQKRMSELMGYDEVGTRGCFCTEHMEALKKDPECAVKKVTPRIAAAA